LQLGDSEMSIETYIQMEGEEITGARIEYWWVGGCCFGNQLRLCHLNVDLHSIDVDDVAPPTI
jgi:hypothetical protein